jgi:hypothetical protein
MSSGEPEFRTTSTGNIIAGVLLGAAGTTAASLANVLVKWTHMKVLHHTYIVVCRKLLILTYPVYTCTLQQNEALPIEKRKPPHKRFMWYLVIFLYIANGALDFAAYGLAPLSVYCFVIFHLIALYLS